MQIWNGCWWCGELSWAGSRFHVVRDKLHLDRNKKWKVNKVNFSKGCAKNLVITKRSLETTFLLAGNSGQHLNNFRHYCWPWKVEGFQHGIYLFYENFEIIVEKIKFPLSTRQKFKRNTNRAVNGDFRPLTRDRNIQKEEKTSKS